MAVILALVQFLGVIGFILLGMAFIGFEMFGRSEATADFASAGFAFLAAAAILVMLTIFWGYIVKRLKSNCKE
jgi:hypothetical protein